MPKLFHRETGWQKSANYLWLESPAGPCLPLPSPDPRIPRNPPAIVAMALILNPDPWQRGLTGSGLRGAGVGFSYCDYDNCTASDTSTAIDNHKVLKAFFKGFPEFAKNDFYITGESYAGIYIPTLVQQIRCARLCFLY